MTCTFPQNLEKGFFISDISTIQIYESKFLNEMEKYPIFPYNLEYKGTSTGGPLLA